MRQFNLDLNLTPAAKAIAKAMAECSLFETSLERTDRILAALAKADLIIVPKPDGNAEAVREAVRTGNWSAVSERDLLAWRDAPREEEAAATVETLDRDKGVPTGRVVEVVYDKGDGTTETIKHTEFVRPGGLAFEPSSVVGMKVVAVRNPGVMETVALQPGNVFEIPPGEKVVEVPGVVLRDNGILAVFYDDGHIAFGGDAADMAAFRDMAATVVGAARTAA